MPEPLRQRLLDYLTAQDVAERMGISARQVQRLARQGRIPYVRRGRLIRVPVAAWETWLSHQKQEALAVVEGENIGTQK